MIRTWLTWIIVSEVAALFLVAGLDAIRSSEGERAASAPGTVVMTRPASRIFPVNVSRSAHGSQIAVEFESVWNVPYRFRGGKPERLRKGGGGLRREAD
jgi:hypothetical protein